MDDRVKVLVRSDGFRQLMMAAAALASVFLLSAACFFGIRRVMAVTTFTVDLVLPAAGVVEATVPLEAYTSLPVTSVQFDVQDMSGTSVWSVTGTAGDSEMRIWTADWPTYSVADGDYHVKARATSTDGVTIGSGPTPVTVMNGSGISYHSISLTFPMEGSVVSGTVPFSATTDSPADAVDFVVRSSTGAPVATLDGFSGDGIGWSGDWSSRTLGNGLYSLTATAWFGGVSYESFNAVTFHVDNPTLSIAVTAPADGSHVYGMVDLRASTTTTVGSLWFRVRDSAGVVVAERIATSLPGSGALSWQATWNAESAPPGSYSLTAEYGGTVSPPVILLVDDTVVSGVSVTMTSPADGTVTHGPLTLRASTSLPVDRLYFAVRDASSAAVDDIPASRSSSEGTAWEAYWDAGLLAAGSYDVFAYSDSFESGSVTVHVEEAATETAVMVEVIRPVSGADTSGLVTLSARTDVPVSLIRFEVWPVGSSFPPETVYGAVSSDILSWSGSWNTDGIGLGDYVVRATALTESGGVYRSPEVAFHVDNGAAAAPSDGVEPEVTVAAPLSGAVLSGSIELVAQTSIAVDSLEFTVSPVTPTVSSGPAVLEATADNSLRTRWARSWNSGTMPDGEYQILATAFGGGGSVSSDPLVVSIANGGAAVELRVELLPPASDGSDITGPVQLKAASSPDSETASLRFLVTGEESGSLSGSLLAVRDTTTGYWTAEWNPESFGTGIFSIKAEATADSGGLFLSQTARVTVADTETLAASLVLGKPTPGQEVIGQLGLAATTTGTVDRVVFRIYPVGVTDMSAAYSVAATRNSTGAWSGSWSSSDAPNGDYAVRATASNGGAAVAQSKEVRIVVRNPLTSDATVLKPLSAVKVVEPVNNSTVGGLVNLVADTVGGASSVTFRIENVETSQRSGVAGKQITGTNRWKGIWGTSGLASGKYSVVATAVSADKTVVSEPIYVSLPSVTEKTIEPLTTIIEPVAETAEEAASGDLIPSKVDVVRPAPGPVKGIVSLAARSEGKITSLKFAVRKSGSTTALLSRVAVYDPAKLLWSTFWNSSGAEPGKYVVVAVGRDVTGQEVRSVPIEVSVQVPTVIQETVRDPVIEIESIPVEAVREAVKEIPEGTNAITAPALPVQFLQEQESLNAECTAAGIAAARCKDWLAAKYRADECRSAGIVTREECVAFLWDQHGGSIPECAGRDKDFCSAYLAKRTEGFLSNSELDEIEQDVLPKIGTVVRFRRQAPSGERPEETESGAGQVSETFAKGVPIKGDDEVTVRVLASPAYARVNETQSRRSVPALVVVDSDGDGLPDDAERRLGTDPFDNDSDGDGYVDSDEIRNGYDPLGPGRSDGSNRKNGLAPIDAAMLSGAPIEQPKSAGEISADLSVGLASGPGGADETEDGAADSEAEEDGETLRFTGRAAPGEVVTLFVYSYLPMVLTTTADANGNWEYDLESGLVDGEHEVYVTVTDETGKIRSKGQPLSFFVAEAAAVTSEEFFGQTVEKSAIITPQDAVGKVFNWYIMGAIGLIVVALSAGIIIVLRPRKPKFEDIE